MENKKWQEEIKVITKILENVELITEIKIRWKNGDASEEWEFRMGKVVPLNLGDENGSK